VGIRAAVTAITGPRREANPDEIAQMPEFHEDRAFRARSSPRGDSHSLEIAKSHVGSTTRVALLRCDVGSAGPHEAVNLLRRWDIKRLSRASRPG
jgi:hypothetical protein